MLFRTLFNSQPEHEPCLLLADERCITYGELLLETARVANALTGLGVQPGDRVAAMRTTMPPLVDVFRCYRTFANQTIDTPFAHCGNFSIASY